MRGLDADAHYYALGRFPRLQLYGWELLTGREVKGEERVWVALTVLMRRQPHLSFREVQAKLPITIGLILRDISRGSSRVGVGGDGCARQGLAIGVDHNALDHSPFDLLRDL